MAYRRIAPFVLLLPTIVIIAPTLVFGAILSPIVTCNGAVEGNNLPACTVCHLAQAAQNVLNVGIFIAIFLSSLLFAWAGILYLTHAASITEAAKAKKLFSSVLIGLILILSSWLIIDTIMKTLVNDKALLGPWNQIC